MKKITSIICSIIMLITTVSIALPTFASTDNSIDTVVEELTDLYQEEAESGKELEESAECRIIVKANHKPDTYGNATLIKGTNKIYIYQYSDITSANDALEHYNSLSYVQWAEADGIMEGQSLSYGNDMMGSDEAKNYIKSNSILTNEVNVAVIDGGINFNKKDFINSGRVIDSGVNLSDSGTEGTAQQDHGNYHGSNITSIILDNTSDSVNIIGYKALNKKGLATDSSVAMCIMTAVDDNVDIINLSLSAKGHSDLIAEAVNYALENNVVVVVSAGNYCDDTADYYPANIENVITVGSVDYNGNRTFFSNYGEEVDFVAPGYNVELYGNKSFSSGTPDYDSGTSFSAPFVTSAAAMALTVDKDLSISQVKSKLIDSCVTQSEINYKSQYYRAVEISNENLNGFVQQGNPETEQLFYGYGMPQMQAIAGITTKSSSVDFSISAGIYNDEFELTLSTEDNADIYYTTDERYPSKNNGTLYTEPIKIDSTTCIRAISYSDDKIKSVPYAEEYKIEYLADEADFKIDERGYITEYTGKGKNGNYIEIKVPDTINGKTVKGVAKGAFYDDTEEDEIEEFGEYDIHLKGISLPDTVEEIEDNSFQNLFSLKYFTANGLKQIGNFALDAPLVYFDAPKVENIGVSGLATNLEKIDLPNLRTIEDSAFCGNPYLSEVNLPSVISGGSTVFSACYRLKSVNMNSCEVLGDESFNLCRSLKTASLSNLSTITYEGFVGTAYNGMFGFCTSLNSIDLPSLKTVESGINRLFYNCENLADFSAPKLENICSEMFSNCYKLVNVIIPKSKTIGERAFYNNVSLNDLSIPNVTSISKDAFCNSTISYIDAAELLTLGSYVFSAEKFHSYRINAMSSREITIIAPKLREIADYAFAYTKMIHSLNLPSLETIGNNAFYESSVNYLYAPNLEKTDSLPVADNSVIVTSKVLADCGVTTPNSTLIIQGEKESFAEEYANKYSLEFVDVNAMGSSIRVTDAGLRFGYSFYDTQNKEVEEYGFVYTNGIADREKLTVDNADNKAVFKLIANNRITHADGITTYNLVFTGIPKAAYNQAVSARAYVKINGKYLYSDIVTRSFTDVVNAVLADNEIDKATKDKVLQLLQS